MLVCCLLKRRWKNEQSPAIMLSRLSQTPWIVGGKAWKSPTIEVQNQIRRE